MHDPDGQMPEDPFEVRHLESGRPELGAVPAVGAGPAVTVGPLRSTDHDDLFAMFADAVALGDGYPQVAPLTRAVFKDTWIRPVSALIGVHGPVGLLGAYYLKPNGPGLGAHIANAGYLVSRRSRRQGIGRALVADSIWRAPLLGFDAIQFNFVFADNPARPLYEELGWQVVGRIPDGVAPGRDAVIYWRAVP
jgi:GNAT superfamily N-acetyltransferase